MKRKVGMSIISVILSIIVTACGTKPQTAEPAASAKPSPNQVAVSGFGTEEVEYSYDSAAQLKSDAEDIIYGEVKDIRYETENGSVSTIEKVEVLESIYGDIEKGTTIKVFRTGGYVTLQGYIDSFPENEREGVRNMVMLQPYSDQELEQKYMKQFSDGEVDTEVGSKSIFFLRFGEVRENVYNRVGGWEGEYVELSTGDYKIPGVESYEEMNSLSASDMESSAEYGEYVVSWDELMGQIQ